MTIRNSFAGVGQTAGCNPSCATVPAACAHHNDTYTNDYPNVAISAHSYHSARVRRSPTAGDGGATCARHLTTSRKLLGI
eukprot:7762052-Pyramimonas_sp.AAC.1